MRVIHSTLEYPPVATMGPARRHCDKRALAPVFVGVIVKMLIPSEPAPDSVVDSRQAKEWSDAEQIDPRRHHITIGAE